MTNIGLGFEKKQHSMLVLCKTKDAVSGSIAHIVTNTYRLIVAKLMVTDSCMCLESAYTA